MNTLVSIIIPAKNRVDFVKDALNSIYSQRIPKNIALEVILVDDLSSPPLSKVLKKDFPKVKFIRNTTKKHGPGVARNIGLKHTKGEYIAFLDSDDKWKPTFIKESLKTLKDIDAPATCCLTAPYFYGKYDKKEIVKLLFLNSIRTICMLFSSMFRNGKLPKDGFFLCQLSHMFFRRGDVIKLKFREDLAAAEDWEFVIKTTSKKEIQIVPLRLVDFRYEMKSYTYSHSSKDAKWKAYRKMLKGIPLSHKKGILYKLFLQYISLFS